MLSSDGITQSLTSHLAAVPAPGNGISPEIMAQIFIGSMTQCSRWWFENRKTISKEAVLAQLSEAIRDLFHTSE